MSARIGKWLKREGDSVMRGEAIVVISTELIDTEIPAPADGILRKILFPEGALVEAGQDLWEIESPRKPDS